MKTTILVLLCLVAGLLVGPGRVVLVRQVRRVRPASLVVLVQTINHH